MLSKPIICLAVLGVLAACGSKPQQDARYLYKPYADRGQGQAPSGGINEDGKLYNQYGQRMETFMPSDTDPSLPGDASDAGIAHAGFHR